MRSKGRTSARRKQVERYDRVVDWESVAKAIALEHAQMSGQPATKLVSQLAQEHKHVTRKGSRSFRFTFRGE